MAYRVSSAVQPNLITVADGAQNTISLTLVDKYDDQTLVAVDITGKTVELALFSSGYHPFSGRTWSPSVVKSSLSGSLLSVSSAPGGVVAWIPRIVSSSPFNGLVSLVSDSAGDVNTVVIHGYDANGNAISENIVLTGTTVAHGAATFRVVSHVGCIGDHAGTITVTATTGGAVLTKLVPSTVCAPDLYVPPALGSQTTFAYVTTVATDALATRRVYGPVMFRVAK